MSSPRSPNTKLSDDDGNVQGPNAEPRDSGSSIDSTLKLRSRATALEEGPRVRFQSGGETRDEYDNRAQFNIKERGNYNNSPPSLPILRATPAEPGRDDFGSIESKDIADLTPLPPIVISKGKQKARSNSSMETSSDDSESHDPNDALGMRHSVYRHKKSASGSSGSNRSTGQLLNLESIPLEDLGRRKRHGVEDDDDEGSRPPVVVKTNPLMCRVRGWLGSNRVKTIEQYFRFSSSSGPDLSAEIEASFHRDLEENTGKFKKWRDGRLTTILKLLSQQGTTEVPQTDHSNPTDIADAENYTIAGEAFNGEGSSREAAAYSQPPSGADTPAPKWYRNENNGPITAIEGVKATGKAKIEDLKAAKNILLNPRNSEYDQLPLPERSRKKRGSMALRKLIKPKKKENFDHLHIQVHVRPLMDRQSYLLKLCRALMSYGAPLHRLEEYMRFSANVLQVQSQFLYVPGCMLVSFDDEATSTAEVKIVRTPQSVNLSKLQDTHDTYKNVLHDKISVDDAIEQLENTFHRKTLYSTRWLIFAYGLASASVGPFAFEARLIDLPFCFFLGLILGVLQLKVAPKNDIYSNVLEITAAIITSFIARALGSIRGGKLFCFSAMAQSAITLILPGYVVLCGSLELQSRNIVGGSVRMVYAVIFSLFLGYGITIGTSFFGAMYGNATSAVHCEGPLELKNQVGFVILFTICLVVINQGRLRQMPMMMITSMVGFLVNHYAAIRFKSNVQVSNTLGAFAIGLVANCYSRLYHGLAAATLLPAIFVQVPSGLAAGGSLISGVVLANNLTNTTSNEHLPSMASVSGAMDAQKPLEVNNMVFNVGYTVIQVAIGITVGLSLAALVLYPCGKKRSAVFTF